jgi:hypothetical protein
MSSTRTPLTSNPLAVFTDARGLTDKEMQLWREMNLSETTFVLPRRYRLNPESKIRSSEVRFGAKTNTRGARAPQSYPKMSSTPRCRSWQRRRVSLRESETCYWMNRIVMG